MNKENLVVSIPGRYDPFHNGHFSVVEKYAEDPRVGKIEIPVCGPGNYFSERHPFTFEERILSIEESTRHLKIPISVYSAPDIENSSKWPNYINSLSSEKIDLVVTGNPNTAKLFAEAGFAIEPAVLEHEISGTLIRDLMAREVFDTEKSWHRLVPQGTKKFIELIKGDQRIARIRLKHQSPVLTSSLIIPVEDWEHITLVKRAFPPYEGRWANSGGHRSPYERLKDTAIREGGEEIIDPKITVLDTVKIHWLKLFDEPYRDPRGDYVDHVYYCEPVSLRSLRAADDAAGFAVFSIYDLPKDEEIAFDHPDQIREFIDQTANLRGSERISFIQI